MEEKKHIKSFNESNENIDKSKLFKTTDFIEWLEKVSPNYMNIKDLEMFVSKYSESN